ncbi:heme exporter protein CcmB [Desulfovibrio inopinatus]|uniref:heme exporter protein CcmB n=1 Tax=Desulfovibrio inopinatus TaxID=102109 RepID=UPI0003FA06B6|nr:heme exporter protein CcmB [Desulfovibrio inopinatus]
MLGATLHIASKDLRLSFHGMRGVLQSVLLGLLLIFLFSLSRNPGDVMPAVSASAVFWLSTVFAQVLVFNTLYGYEEQSGARIGLVLSPAPVQAVWLGKALAGGILLVACQCVFALATVVFLGQPIDGPLWLFGVAGVLVDVAVCALGSLLGALSAGNSTRESLMTVILFPLLIPALLAGIRLFEAGLAGVGVVDVSSWIGMATAFDAVFSAAALVLFPYVYTGEE